MARKDLMKGLMEEPDAKAETPKPPARVDPAKPRYSSGAIGAVSRSIADLKSRSLVELDPRMIDNAGLKDRLDKDDPDHVALVKSIEEYGQQVPVLVRVSPNYPGRYEVVYGRRRVAALKELGQPVRAMVRDLNDKALILAQGQENSARKDLTFIEKANFARQMRDARYDRKVIGDALAMDKTLISRLLAVADQVPVELIEAIGSAPSVGRDRWLALAEKIDARDLTEFAVGNTSDARFNAVLAATKVKPPKPTPPEKITTSDGIELAKVTRKGDQTQITVDANEGFADWLAEHLTEIHRDWKKKRGE